MRSGTGSLRESTMIVLAPGVLLLALGASYGRGDEPGRLSRFFRFGNANASVPAASPTPESIPLESVPSGPASRSTEGILEMPGAANPGRSTSLPRLVPQPRRSQAVTDSDPIITRVALTRTTDGSQFGMFLQVFADGTVLDGEGVHHVGREGIRAVLQAMESGDVFRLKGHCGGPPTDSLETVHLVVYERSLGRLRANAFSFSGNPNGCDHAVRHLQTVLDTLQAKLSRPVNASVTTSPSGVSTPVVSPEPLPLSLSKERDDSANAQE